MNYKPPLTMSEDNVLSWEYKVVVVSRLNSGLAELRDYYAEGWQFVDSAAEFVSSSSGGSVYGAVYFTIKKPTNEPR